MASYSINFLKHNINSSHDGSNVLSRRNSPGFLNPRLPPELCDMIIDSLCGDKVNLATCTLVSRVWKYTARQHLFEDVLVAHCRWPTAEKIPYQEFLDFLRETPDVGPLIRTLYVEGFKNKNTPHGCLDATFVDAVMEHVPRLKGLALLNCGWRRTKSDSMHLYKRPQRYIENIYINGFIADKGPPYSKLEILRHFSYIENLYLTRLWIGHFDVDGELGDLGPNDEDSSPALLNPAPLLSVQVKTLTLSLADVCPNFLEYLHRQPFVASLVSLTIRDIWGASFVENNQDLILVGDMIRDRMYTSLETFEIDLPRHGPFDGSDAFAALHLESCTSLSKVTINLLLDGRDRPCAEDDDEQDPEDENDDEDDDGDHTHNIQTEDGDEDGGNGAATGDHEGSENVGTGPVTQQPDAPNITPQPTEAGHTGAEGQQLHAPPRPPRFYTANEWGVLNVILSHLPPSVNTITIGVELTGPNLKVTNHLTTVPDWKELEQQFLRLPNLQSVRIRRLETVDGEILLFRKWEHTDEQGICKQLEQLFTKKLLVFDK
ncbi:hypothetical protein BC835DRAFT_1418447 [Cytidiella melzeri]|nr:hypothetical protein BC835DRAFT_1418447 [Cytidiella melzeri]